MQQLVVWNLDQQRYALPLHIVDRAVRAVAITPLPDAPDIVCGIINIQGEIVPVISVRLRFGLRHRDIALSDQLLIATTKMRKIALLVDAVSGIIDHPGDTRSSVDLGSVANGCISGIMKFPDGMILIHDLDQCLSLDDERALERLLMDRQEKGGHVVA